LGPIGFGVFGIIVLILVVLGPFVASENHLAQSLYGVIVTCVATGLGIWASKIFGSRTDKEHLTRYGLSAWRNLDSLSVKIRQRLNSEIDSSEVIEAWLLDVDQAKLAWKDLLHEVFDLQKRLEAESEEVALKYKEQMERAESDKEKHDLERKKRAELTKINSKAPLPIKKYEVCACPSCGASIEFKLGDEKNSTAWPICKECGATFPVHRQSEDDFVVNENAMKVPVRRTCADCGYEMIFSIPTTRNISFSHSCPSCQSGLKCSGRATSFEVSKI
tara:strand:+ start:185 stop:1012 length:828 start_codon:yes stop_codon:yes gene_type:complete